jgi:hypothetical protein
MMAANHVHRLGVAKMKKTEVKIGGKYYAKVTNRRVEIRIDAVRASGGWEATNLATGKKIHIKSAQRLQGEVGERRGSTKVSAVVESESATVDAIGGESFTTVAVLKKPRKAKPVMPQSAREKRLSCIAAALKVLCDSGEPMNAQEMITAMQAKGYWSSPGGKTPHATLYSAILRDLSKGDDARFVKTERGRFTIRS